jgi:hypothetical protein
VAKAVVAGVLIWACTTLVSLAALVGWIVLFGAHPVVFPAWLAGGLHLHGRALLLRYAIATAYVAFGFTALLALGTLFSTLTNTATSAIGRHRGGVHRLGNTRRHQPAGPDPLCLPTHYLSAWRDTFIQNSYPTDMLVGLAMQVAYLLVPGAVAIAWFRRKDIRSRA